MSSLNRIVPGPALKQGTEGEEVRLMQQALADYGYRVPVNGSYDHATTDVVTAFQRHFRPEKVDGIADRSTLATLRRLLATRSGEAVA